MTIRTDPARSNNIVCRWHVNQTSGPANGYMRARSLRRDIVDYGVGYIAGTVTINGVPASRKVRLFDLTSGRLIREKWSEQNGAYRFGWIDQSRNYFVVAHDYSGSYNAVIADVVTPDPDAI